MYVAVLAAVPKDAEPVEDELWLLDIDGEELVVLDAVGDWVASREG